MFHVKVQGRGGLLRARRIMAIAEAAGIPCIVGQISEMSIGATADAVLAASVDAHETVGGAVRGRCGRVAEREYRDDGDRGERAVRKKPAKPEHRCLLVD